MTIQSENTIRAIVQNDPDFETHLDFQVLRKKGMERLGELAGKIWTDHNRHDPGVTIFENLCYALTDLGYRTHLPFEDIIAAAKRAEVDDNFLTPLQALTVNPVTILDYRKLLLEIPGVNNAWLAPAERAEVPMIFANNQLICDPKLTGLPIYDKQRLQLNGLYNVIIEKEETADDARIIAKARDILSAHRNLCEDFKKVDILEAEQIGICAEVEILPEADAEKVYRTLITAIAQFIQPKITYYTLPELLDKGKSIESIFAGRPFSKKSHGFVDTEELEALPFREEIYLSDLYNVILGIEGIRRVRKIHFKGGVLINEDNPNWEEGISLNGKATIFSIDDTCIDLYSPAGFVAINKSKIHQSLTNNKKSYKAAYLLDGAIPRGIHRKDLADYYSIQEDFPVVYGVGEEGLPDSASKTRQAQALQLKGYLLFFDQLLANYLAQLANVRSLFSAKAEHLRSEKEKTTYATETPSSVAGIEELIRFYGDEESMVSQGVIAVPVVNDADWCKQKEVLAENSRAMLRIPNHCHNGKAGIRTLVDHFSTDSAAMRDIRINRMRDAFIDGDYSVEVLQDKFGCFFVFSFSKITDLVLVGHKRFPSVIEAREAAEQAAFIATLEDNYAKDTLSSTTVGKDTHYFDLVYKPVSYARYIQELTEDESAYLSRRKEFLDHLLARFSEQFTDYAITQYESDVSALEQQKEAVHKQSLFLSNYADISRNRGKAFDYFEPSWNTDNVSGFEKRIAAMTGMDNYQRQNLCNFEVVQCFSSTLNDDKGDPIFRKSPTHGTKEAMVDEAVKILSDLRNPDQYEMLDKKLQGFNYLGARRMFSPKADPQENIEVARWEHRIELLNAEDKIVKESSNRKYTSVEHATKELANFVKNINTQTTPDKGDEASTLRLLRLEKKAAYLNVDALPLGIDTEISWKWHVLSLDGKTKTSSPEVFFNVEEAWSHLEQTDLWEKYLVPEEAASRWRIQLPGSDFSLDGLRWYPKSKQVLTAWMQAKIAGKEIRNYTIEQTEKKQYVLQLKNAAGRSIASSKPLPDEAMAKQYLSELLEIFNSKKVTPEYESLRGKYSFQIPNSKGEVIMESYQAYDSVAAAIAAMQIVYKLGVDPKKYFLSGDAANPAYIFLLQDEHEEFIAGSPIVFETEEQRLKAQKATIQFLRRQEIIPITVSEEPRQYSWSATMADDKIIQSSGTFSTKAKATKDFDETIVDLIEGNAIEEPTAHIYKTQLAESPASYRYVYGVSDANNAWMPLYQSKEEFTSAERATTAYKEMVVGMPQLKFVQKQTANVLYELVDETENKSIVIAYTPGNTNPVSPERANSVHVFVSDIFGDGGPEGETIVNPDFIDKMTDDGANGRYLWRYLKKNAPIAFVPRKCDDLTSAELLKRIACNIYPFIDLDECPKPEVVVCPDAAVKPKRYHWQLRIKWRLTRKDFVINSYQGYNTKEEARAAYDTEWFDVLQLAKDRSNYGLGKSIALRENYAPLESQACEAGGVRAVVPKDCLDLFGDMTLLVEFFEKMASYYPIYPVLRLDGTTCYKYKVTYYQDDTGWPCTAARNDNEPGNMVWQSVDCYDSIAEAIKGYQHFIPYVVNPNACRIFCKNGKYSIGIYEILAESDCIYNSAAEAWNQGFPNLKNISACGECLPGGVREFVYAAEDEDNFICEKEGNRWKFKVVAPDYYLVKHNCTYDAIHLRDQAMADWKTYLESLALDYFFPKVVKDSNNPNIFNFPWGQVFYLSQQEIQRKNNFAWLCEIIGIIRDLLKDPDFFKLNYATQLAKVNAAISEWGQLSAESVGNWANWMETAKRFPIFKKDDKYCFRIYYAPNDQQYPPLKRCGCEEEPSPQPPVTIDPSIDDATLIPDKPDFANKLGTHCKEIYPFESKQCFDCCEGAAAAFVEFLRIMKGQQYELQATQEECYGPYSFCIVNPQRVIAYHPQQYRTAQEAVDAKLYTQECLAKIGMHLLEHILLRPRSHADCFDIDHTDPAGIPKSCLLPICPDENCKLEWDLDDENDPCAEEADPMCYTPGADPYSFWATIALPAWKKQFRDAESRKKFEQLLYQEVPALVGLHILWLSPHDMCKFEDEYRTWLELVELQGEIGRWESWPNNPKYKGRCGNENEPPICAIVDCIRTLRSELPCPGSANGDGNCDCDEPDEQVTDDCCLPEESNGTIFWADCPPDQTVVLPVPVETTGEASDGLVFVEAEPVGEVSTDGPGVIGIVNNELLIALSSLIFNSGSDDGASVKTLSETAKAVVKKEQPIALASADSTTDTKATNDSKKTKAKTSARSSAKPKKKATSKKIKTKSSATSSAAPKSKADAKKTKKMATTKPSTESKAKSVAKTTKPKASAKPSAETTAKTTAKKTKAKATTKPSAEPKAKAASKKTKTKSSDRPSAEPKAKASAKKTKAKTSATPNADAKAIDKAKRFVRLRKPGYLENIFNLKDERILTTKSFERTVHFLKNPPSLTGYLQLLKFFIKHTLGREGGVPDEAYFTLLKNASWHVFDKIVLEKTTGLKAKDEAALKEVFALVEEKGLTMKAIQKGWKVNQIKSICHVKALEQIKKLLK